MTQHRLAMLVSMSRLTRAWRRINRLHFGVLVCVALVLLLALHFSHSSNDNSDSLNARLARLQQLASHNATWSKLHAKSNNEQRAPNLVQYDRTVPLIWIGGVPRSGTTLMRALLDAHGDIRCGEETRVIPRILGIHSGMTKSELEMTRLKEAHIDEQVLNEALGAYMLSIISQHGEPANRLCNKDPFTLRSMARIQNIFPNSKFILMIRDGRATVHSIISRKVTIKNFDIKSYRGALRDWNKAIESMYSECKRAADACLAVHYEQLVLPPEPQMRRILQFLEVPWDGNVLQHEKMVGNQISLSKCVCLFI